MVRHWAHIVLGAGLPWLPPEINIGGVIFFCAYQFLQFKHLSHRLDRDDSYLDVKETVIAYIISAVVKKIIGA